MAVHTTWIYVLCSPEEREMWAEKAKTAGMGLSEWLRLMANNSAAVAQVEEHLPRKQERGVSTAPCGPKPEVTRSVPKRPEAGKIEPLEPKEGIVCEECRRPNLQGRHAWWCGYAQRMWK